MSKTNKKINVQGAFTVQKGPIKSTVAQKTTRIDPYL